MLMLDPVKDLLVVRRSQGRCLHVVSKCRKQVENLKIALRCHHSLPPQEKNGQTSLHYRWSLAAKWRLIRLGWPSVGFHLAAAPRRWTATVGGSMSLARGHSMDTQVLLVASPMGFGERGLVSCGSRLMLVLSSRLLQSAHAIR